MPVPWILLCMLLLTNIPSSLQELEANEVVIELEAQVKHITEDSILCKACGAEVSSALKVIDKKSPFSENYHTENLFGIDIPVQELTNPHGIKFSVITAQTTLCSPDFGPWYSADTWFPGFVWKLCRCRTCHTHVGWVFEPGTPDQETSPPEPTTASSEGFSVLILSKVISEFYSDSLIQTWRS